MNKGELIAELVRRTGLTRADAARALEAMLEVVRTSVAKGERVSLAGFGTFERRRRNARIGRNPHTGEAVEIPARDVPAWRPGEGFRAAVQGRRGPGARR